MTATNNCLLKHKYRGRRGRQDIDSEQERVQTVIDELHCTDHGIHNINVKDGVRDTHQEGGEAQGESEYRLWNDVGSVYRIPAVKDIESIKMGGDVKRL